MSATDRSPRWRIGLAVAGVAAAARLLWVLCVPTIVVGDFATYRESAVYLSEHGRLDDGFIYMPGLVLLLAAIHRLGGEVLASKLVGVVCGGIAAGALYVATAGLADSTLPANLDLGQPPIPPPRRRSRDRDGSSSSNARLPKAASLVALLFGLWLPGIATASVVGTDVPCAAMMCVALACLFQWGRARPRAAAMAFGGAMGVAAYFRAVALPLVLFSVGYWFAVRVPARQVLARAAFSAAVTLLVLMPWAIRNYRATGSLAFTDTHGGITALMGNDPNTEGTYSRALFGRFHALTGRTFLSLPHADTDRAAYDIARGWIAFQPAWTAGMVALRLGRLLAPERGLLYWSVYRPGVLPETATLWFNDQRSWVTGIVDAYGWILVLGLCAGVAFAIVDRHFVVLVPILLALALLATYALFVAEPRYRLTSEIVAFPTAAWGWSRLAGALRAAARTAGRDGRQRQRWPRLALRGLGATVFTLVTVLVGGWSIVKGGRLLRERYRWAVSVSTVAGHAQQTFWRTSPDRSGPSMVEGTTDGVIIRTGARTPPAIERGETIVEMILPAGLDREMRDRVPVTSGPAPLSQTFRMRIAWSPTQVGCASLELRAPLARLPFAVAGPGASELAGVVSPETLRDPRHPGRALVMVRLLADPAPGRERPVCSVRLSEVELSTAKPPLP